MGRPHGLSKSNNDFSIASSNFQVIEDTGYRAVCPKCTKRHGALGLFVGKCRDIELKACEPCFLGRLKKPVDEYGFSKEKEGWVSKKKGS